MTAGRLLVFEDRDGNGDQFSLQVPADMTAWRVDAFLDFIAQDQWQRQEA